MFVARKKYDALERERAFLAESLETYRGIAETDSRTIATLREQRNNLMWQVRDTCRRAERAEARLAKFTAPRARDGAGRFLPDNGEVARG